MNPPGLMASVPLLEQTAIFAERRQDLLAGNIANISTPGYRARDLPVAEFQAALRAALQSPSGKSAHSVSASGSVGESLLRTGKLELPRELFEAQERPPTTETTYQDAAHRNVEQEVLELTKNSMLQRFATEMLTAQFQLLETVLAERVM